MALDAGGKVEGKKLAQPLVSIRPDGVPNWQVPTLTPNPALYCRISKKKKKKKTQNGQLALNGASSKYLPHRHRFIS
jgi:hypothetical protein